MEITLTARPLTEYETFGFRKEVHAKATLLVARARHRKRRNVLGALRRALVLGARGINARCGAICVFSEEQMSLRDWEAAASELVREELSKCREIGSVEAWMKMLCGIKTRMKRLREVIARQLGSLRALAPVDPERYEFNNDEISLSGLYASAVKDLVTEYLESVGLARESDALEDRVLRACGLSRHDSAAQCFGKIDLTRLARAVGDL